MISTDFETIGRVKKVCLITVYNYFFFEHLRNIRGMVCNKDVQCYNDTSGI